MCVLWLGCQHGEGGAEKCRVCVFVPLGLGGLGPGLKARAWARLWGLGLDEMESPALGEGSGRAGLGLGLSPGLWTIEYSNIGDAKWDVAIWTH